jgi:hypothetical protein
MKGANPSVEPTFCALWLPRSAHVKRLTTLHHGLEDRTLAL